MYNIISTGSKGNAVIIKDRILIDCGVSYKSIAPYVKGLSLVLLTHIHGDHFNKRTISKLASERPALRFGCCQWLVRDLIDCGVSKYMIDIFAPGTANHYTVMSLSVEAFPLYHNVPNCGYKVDMAGWKVMYATDTCKLETAALGYDLYMIEANYDEDELQERIARKEAEGAEFIYDNLVPENHLSRKDASDFVMKNAGANSEFVFLHVHEEGGKQNAQQFS
jgi:L-ascorbate metabolism protein UlaG (beta-lactamase superfamily)